jgi:high-affinity nickel-transport protein
VLASVAVALLAAAFKGPLASLRDIGGVLATLFSSGFLLLIAEMNCAILAGIWRRFRAVRAGQLPPTEDAGPLSGGGPLARIFRPLFRLIRRSWHMLPLGFLFGLGFDTASEIGLLGLAAAEASKGMPIWSILVFPALFTAGMALVDAADSVLMLGAYGWAFARPVRRLFYNLVITGVSVLVALVVGGIEALGLLRDQLDLQGVFWDAIDGLNDHFDMLGYLIVGLFMASWLVSVLVYRLGGFDALDREHSAG